MAKTELGKALVELINAGEKVVKEAKRMKAALDKMAKKPPEPES
jgi:hypothetical protein